jgi:membrane-bound lytic murein transglycosylase MltF
MARHSSWRLVWLAWALGASVAVAAEPRWTTDLDDMKARHVVRVLVVYSKTFYFLDGAQPHGISYELGETLERELNAGNADRTPPIRVAFVLVSRDQLIPALIEGRGDIAAMNLTITPERLERVDFSTPFAEEVSEVLVTSANTGVPVSVEGLSGRKVFVRRSSSYFASLENLNRALRQQRKAPVTIVLADENLEDADILEMVNAGLVDATVVDSYVARFWSQVFPHLRAQPQIALRARAKIAWAIRKGNPLLKRAVDDFAARNRVGTTLTDNLLRRYLQDTRWVHNATADADMRRFRSLSKYFQKYARQYRFEWLMLVAQGYEESGLNQNMRSPEGAVGVMQVKRDMALETHIDLPDIENVETNIQAGVKYLRYLVDQYFNEPGIDLTNRHLFAFAAYHSDAKSIAKLRKDAAAAGLDPNIWFYNVELLAARELGRDTVQYVSNIFKYYVAYRLVLERGRSREAIRRQAG